MNAQDKFDNTPLHYAVSGTGSQRHEKEKKEIVELLIAKGADVNAIGLGGKTPLDNTGIKGEKADLLRKHGGKTKKELEAAGN